MANTAKTTQTLVVKILFFLTLFLSYSCLAQLSESDITLVSPKFLKTSNSKYISEIKQSILDNAKEIFETDNLTELKEPILVEFFDYNCGYCKKMAKTISAYVSENPNVQVIYKEFPIRGEQSRYAAKAAIASKKQNQYVRYHRSLMYFDGITHKTTLQQANKLKMDIAKLEKDMSSPETLQVISANYSLAKKLKIRGTPTFFIFNLTDNQPHIYYIQGAIDWTELSELLINS